MKSIKQLLKLSLFGLFLLKTQIGISQKNNYKPISGYEVHKDTISRIISSLKTPAYDHRLERKKAITKFEEICQERSNYIKNLNDAGLIMTGDTITNWINEVLFRLVEANPMLQELNYKVYTHRSSICNAYNIGEGVILINLGLLMSIDSEEELAFVLAHEISHDILKHVMESTKEQSALYGDKDYLKSLKKASKLEYGAYTELERILLAVMSNKMLHSRGNEYLADSLGFELYSKADYDFFGAIGLLEVLDSSDYFIYDFDIDLKQYLTTEGFELNDEWFSNEDLDPIWSKMEHLYEIPDSLKTHPGCDERIASVKRIAKIKEEVKVKKTGSYIEYEGIIKFELIQSLIEDSRPVEAMYYAVKLLELEPENTYLHCVMANSILEIHDALKNMEFRWYVPFPDESFPLGYNKILSFFHNMNSKKLQSLFLAYVSQHITDSDSDDFVTYVQFRKRYFKNEITLDQIIEYEDEIKNTYFKQKVEVQKENYSKNKLDNLKNDSKTKK